MEWAYKECGLEMSYYNLRFVELVVARETQEAKQGQTDNDDDANAHSSGL